MKEPSNAVGMALRRARRERRLSLQELGRRSGLSAATLSRLETGRLPATYDRITQLAEAIGVAVPQLFAAAWSQPRRDARRVVSRQQGRPAMRTAHYEYQTLGWELPQQSMFPVVARLLCRTLDEFGPLVRHEGEEFVYVLRGRARIVNDGHDDAILEPGDSLYLDSTLGHAFLDASDDGQTLVVGCATIQRP